MVEKQKKNIIGGGDTNLIPLDAWKPCVPNIPMSVTVSASTDVLSLTPTLLHPDIDAVRVEVNGQVLSRVGDIWADQLADTTTTATSMNTTSIHSSTALLLPAAFIMGMQPGAPVSVDVVVVAEDGVTSAHYSVAITREEQQSVVGNVTYGNEQQHGWPLAPSQLPSCQVCPAGWSSSGVDATACDMCPPGTAAAAPGNT